MSAEIIIAMVTAVASLVVAIVSSRQSARAQKLIEELKFELEKKRSAKAMGDEYFKQSIESADRLIRSIQQLKDILQLITSAHEASMAGEAAIKLAAPLCQDLVRHYEQELPNLNDVESEAAHRVKNKALAIEMILREALRDKAWVSELSEEQRRSLVRLRNDLTEDQHILRDSKMTRLADRVD